MAANSKGVELVAHAGKPLLHRQGVNGTQAVVPGIGNRNHQLISMLLEQGSIGGLASVHHPAGQRGQTGQRVVSASVLELSAKVLRPGRLQPLGAGVNLPTVGVEGDRCPIGQAHLVDRCLVPMRAVVAVLAYSLPSCSTAQG